MVILALTSTIIFIVVDVIALKRVLEENQGQIDKKASMITVISGGIMYASILSVLIQAL